MTISFKKKPSTESIWVKDDASKPFERCTDITKLPKDVLDTLEKEGYDEEDEAKVYKFNVGDHGYRINYWQGEWQCSRWPVKKGGSGGGWTKGPSGPREWSYNRMVDFEFGNLNQLHDILMNSDLDDDETWELMPDIVMNSKNEPHGIMRKMKRISMIGSEEKNNSDSKEKEENE